MSRPAPFFAATLAVGTEITDGQILDRNSAWISQKLVHEGIQVIEHRAVADDRAEIARALGELSAKVDLLFVTGGLGPTSDDFTRDLLAEVFGRPLEFHPASWQQVQDKLTARGVQVREIQRQQCFFPKGSRVLDNPLGTANGFAFDATQEPGGRMVRLVALPGPPAEIAAVWEQGLAQDLSALVPEAEREKLFIYRCLGRGESEIAELTEEIVSGSGVRVGYRAHVPYVEVKLWAKANDVSAQAVLLQLRQRLQPWIVNENDEDASDKLLARCLGGGSVRILDFATSGLLQERLGSVIRGRNIGEGALDLVIETVYSGVSEAGDSGRAEIKSKARGSEESVFVALLPDHEAQTWWLYFREASAQEREIELKPNFNLKIQSERAKRFVTEKTLLLF
jgi:nicotinamide-nucleotide amidase